LPAVVASCGWWTIATTYLRTLGRVHRGAALLAATCACASLVASNSNGIGSWIDRSPLAQLVRSPAGLAGDVAALLTGPKSEPAIDEGASLLRLHAKQGLRPVVVIRSARLTSVLLAAHQGNALPIVNGNQDGLIDRPALMRVAAAADRLPEGTIVLTETTFMRHPPRSFAHLDPIRDGELFGDYFVSRSYAALAERFDLRVLERGLYGYVVLEVGKHR
jgi:hypothetical protein